MAIPKDATDPTPMSEAPGPHPPRTAQRAPPTALPTLHGALPLPQFLPDATYGVVRAVDAEDLEPCGIAALVMNAFHLTQRPAAAAVQALGGLHSMSGWRGPIVT